MVYNLYGNVWRETGTILALTRKTPRIQTAYGLWLSYTDTYQNFANGFADTSYDTYTFGNIAQQSDGTVQVDVTIIATSTSYQQTTYCCRTAVRQHLEDHLG